MIYSPFGRCAVWGVRGLVGVGRKGRVNGRYFDSFVNRSGGKEHVECDLCAYAYRGGIVTFTLKTGRAREFPWQLAAGLFVGKEGEY